MVLPLDAYRHSGANRPSLQALDRYITGLEPDNRPSTRVVVADMYLDRAVAEPATARESVAAAGKELETVLDVIESFDPKYAAIWGARAVLRRAELPSWLEAASGSYISNRYNELLNAAYQAEYFKEHNQKAESRLIEFMPVLLGSRAEAWAMPGVIGWIGRLALEREDEGPWNNWDAGISRGSRSADYVQPQYLLDIKRSRSNKGSSQGALTDAIRVVARTSHFRGVSSIVASCFAEQGRLPQVMQEEELYTSQELDDITVVLWQEVTASSMSLS